MTTDDFKIKLSEDRIYLVLDELPDKIGGLYMPQTQAAASRIGTVKCIGPDVKQYKVGDRLVVSSYAGVGLYLLQYGMTDNRHSVYREGEIIGQVE